MSTKRFSCLRPILFSLILPISVTGCKPRQEAESRIRSEVSIDGKKISLLEYFSTESDRKEALEELKGWKVNVAPNQFTNRNAADVVQGQQLYFEEKLILNVWTTNFYVKLNEALQNANPADDASIDAITRVLASALNKLRGFSCTATRGNPSPPRSMSELATGQSYVETGFRAYKEGSTPPNAWKGARHWSRITSGNCKSIKAFSAYPDENEVLFAPGADFKVLTNGSESGHGLLLLQHQEERSQGTASSTNASGDSSDATGSDRPGSDRTDTDDRDDLICSKMATGYYSPTSVSRGTSFATKGTTLPVCKETIENLRNGVICATDASGYYVPKTISDSRSLGVKGITLPSCIEAVQKNQNGVLCSTDASGYFVLKTIADGKALGVRGITLPSCIDALEHMVRGVVCATDASGYFVPKNIANAAALAVKGITLPSCNQAVEGISEGVICGTDASGYFVPKNIENGVSLGTRGIQLSSCLDTVKNIKKGVICSTDVSGYFVPKNIANGSTLSSKATTLSSCIDSISH